MNPFDPLFGGLIPRREIQEQPRAVIESSHPAMPRPNMSRSSSMSSSGGVVDMPPVRQSGMDKIKAIHPQNPLEGRNVVFDWTEQKINLAKKEQELESQKFGYAKDLGERKHSLDSREQDRKETKDRADYGIEVDKREIDHRKQALDEWKTKNPEGEIKTLEDGKIVVIDKRTGQSIETGLKADHLSEKEKLALAHGYRMSEIAEREKQQKTNAPDKVVNPSQQRTAERDAANELLNDPNYSWLSEKGVVAITPEGVVIKRPEKGSKWTAKGNKDIDDTHTVIDNFEKEWKKRSEARMNKSIGGNQPNVEETIDMVAPDGRKLKVPPADVQRLKDAGAKLMGEDYVKPVEAMPPVDDKIELFYDREGKVIGARNRKNPSVSKFEE